jgi:hypothetical protein
LDLYTFVQGWKWIPLLICVEKGWCVGDIENIFHLMVDVMVTFKGLSVELLGVKLISMGYDGKNVF